MKVIYTVYIIYCYTKQEAQLLLEKADRTAYIRSPACDFQSCRESDFSRGDTVSCTLC